MRCRRTSAAPSAPRDRCGSRPRAPTAASSHAASRLQHLHRPAAHRHGRSRSRCEQPLVHAGRCVAVPGAHDRHVHQRRRQRSRLPGRDRRSGHVRRAARIQPGHEFRDHGARHLRRGAGDGRRRRGRSLQHRRPDRPRHPPCLPRSVRRRDPIGSAGRGLRGRRGEGARPGDTPGGDRPHGRRPRRRDARHRPPRRRSRSRGRPPPARRRP